MSAFLIRADRADLKPMGFRATVWVGSDGTEKLNEFKGLRAFPTREAAEAALFAVRMKSPYATCDVVEFVKKPTPEGEKTDAVVAKLYENCTPEQIAASERAVERFFKTSIRSLLFECWKKDDDTRVALSACVAAIVAGAKNGRIAETLEELTTESLKIAERHIGADELRERLHARR